MVAEGLCLLNRRRSGRLKPLTTRPKGFLPHQKFPHLSEVEVSVKRPTAAS